MNSYFIKPENRREAVFFFWPTKPKAYSITLPPHILLSIYSELCCKSDLAVHERKFLTFLRLFSTPATQIL